MKKKIRKGFKNALLVAAMLSMSAGIGYADTNVTDDDVTTAGHRYVTTDNNAYYITTPIHDHPVTGTNNGTIYHPKSGTVYVQKDNNFTNNSSYNGGAIYLNGSGSKLDVTDANFTGNSATQNGSSAGGGAIFNKGIVTINASTQDVTFSGNTVTGNSHGGAIYNSRELNINATGGDVIFTGNTNTTSGLSDAVYMTSTNARLNVNTSADRTVQFLDRITGNSTGAIITKTGAGTLEIGADMSGYNGAVNITEGILKTTNGGGVTNTLFNNASTTTTFSDGTKISSINGVIDTTDLGKLTMNGDIYLMFDVKLSDATSDQFTTTGTITDNGHKIKIGINNMSAIDISAADEVDDVILSDNSAVYTLMTLDTSHTTGDLLTKNYTIDLADGKLKFTANSTDDLWDVINETVTTEKSYPLTADYDLSATAHSDLGSLYRNKLIVVGNDHTITGGGTTAGVTVGSGKELVVSDSAFTNFTKSGYGGAIYNNGGTVTLTNVDFTGNTAYDNGGAIYNDGGTVTLTNVDFSNNSSTNGSGGAIHNEGTINSITGDLSNNTADEGGAIYNYGGTITSITGDLSNNTANNGGAIFNKVGAEITTINGSFSNNTTNGSGGAIYNEGTIGTLGSATSTFSGNTADGDGGAIFNKGGAEITTINGNFLNNEATSGSGGAIYNEGTIGTIGSATSSFSGNTAYSDGGTINNGGGTITTINGSFSNNESTIGSGGAIYNNGGTIGTIGSATSSFSGNTAYSDGGAIYNSGGAEITTINGSFSNNTSTNSYGGAIYNNGTISSIKGNFTSNTANNGRGGAIYNYGTITITDDGTNSTVFTGNTDSTGSNAIHNEKGTVTFDGTKNIIMNDKLTSAYTSDTNQGKYVKQGTGALVLNNSMSGVLGDVDITGGTVKIDSTTGGMFFTNAHNTTFNGTNLTLDTQDGTVNATALGTLTMNSDVAMKIDVNTNAGTGDTFSATAVSGTGEFVLSAGNMINVGTGTEASFAYEIADSVLRSHINETVSGSEIESSAKSWAIGYSKSSGVLTFTMGSLLGIKAAINDNTHTSYTLNANETVSGDIGAMGEKASMLIESTTGNKFTVDGDSHSGMTIGTYGTDPQEMTINNATFTNFTRTGVGTGGAINNDGGTVTLTNVDFENNKIIVTSEPVSGDADANYSGGGAIRNNGTGTISALTGNFSGNKVIATATSNDGKAEAYMSGGGAVMNWNTMSTINGDFTNNSVNVTSTVTSGSGDANSYGAGGGAIYNTNAITSITGDFSGNSATVTSTTQTGAAYTNYFGGGAIRNGGTISGAILGDFTNNTVTATATSNSGGKAESIESGGGAIRNEGTISGAITGTFSGNTANINVSSSGATTTANSGGGAIWNKGTISSISGSTFTSNSTNLNGGAIYNVGTITNITDSNFTGNTAGGVGGAIYSSGNISINAAGSDVSFTSNKQNSTEANDIYMDGQDGFPVTLSLNANDGQSITIGSGIDGQYYNIGINSGLTTDTGTVIFNGNTTSDTDLAVTVNRGTLDNNATISGAVTIASGAKLYSTTSNITGTLTNNGTYYLEDTALTSNTTVSGTGTTIVQNAIDVSANLTVAGTLDTNSKVIDMTQTTPVYNTVSAGVLNGGTFKIDMDFTDSSKADKIATTSTTTASTGTITISDINLVGSTYPSTPITHQILTNAHTSSTLQLALGITQKVVGSGDYSYDDPIQADTNWGTTYYHHDITGATLYGNFALNDAKDSITTTITAEGGSHSETSLGDTLKLVVEDTTNSVKTFNATANNQTYNVTDSTGIGTLSGKLTVSGTGYTNTVINGNSKGGIAVAWGNELILKDIEGFNNFSKSSQGGAILNNATLTIDDTTFANNVSSEGGAICNWQVISHILDTTFGSTTDSAAGNKATNGGAIANTGTIGNIGETAISGAFGYNKASATNDYTRGGALYNTGTITKLSADFAGNTATATVDSGATFDIMAQGGAIANFGTIDSVSGTFTNNSSTGVVASGSTASAEGFGGAIYNEGGTIGTLTGNFTGNSATDKGGAIYNNGGSVKITDDGTNNTVFTGNTANGVSNAIYSEGGTVTFDGTKSVVMNDRMTSNTTATFNKNGTGTLVLGEDMTGVKGVVNFNGGTIKLTNNAVDSSIHGTFFDAASTTIAGGTTLDAQNGYLENGTANAAIYLGDSVTLTGNMNAKIDVDLSGSTSADIVKADMFSAGSAISGADTYKIVLNTITANVLTNISETSTVEPPIDGSTLIRKIADDNVKAAIQLGSDVKFKGLLANGGDYKWLVTYSRDTGNLTFANGWSLKEAINYKNGAYQSDIDVVYNAVENETTGTIGNLGGHNTTVNMNGYTIDGDGGSGIVVQNVNQQFALNNANVTNFTKADNGAFINDTKGATIILSGSTFDSISATGSSKNGGVVYAQNGLTTTNSSFTNNSATGSGGALYLYNGTTKIDATVDGTKFAGNTAKSGGAIYDNNNNTVLTINGNGGSNMITFGGAGEGNSATDSHGGAIYKKGTMSATNVSFINNTATSNGGAIYSYGKATNLDATIDGVKLTGNSAKSGGAIYVGSSNSGALNINQNGGTKAITFGGTGSGESNTATDGSGGAIYKAGAMTALNASFINNTATSNGGAIYSDGNALNLDATLDGIKFAGNSAKSGGAIFNNGNNSGTININGNGGNKKITFGGVGEGNSATDGSGGAIYSRKNLTVNNADFISNTASANGGAIYMSNTGNSITNATFKSNSATNFGGAIYTDGTVSTLSGTFGGTGSGEGNSAKYGGAIYNNSSKTINEITGDFTNNSASTANGGGAIYNKGTVTIKTNTTDNITFSGNKANGVSNAIHSEGGTVNFDGTKSIIMNDRITSNTAATFNKNGTGTLVLAENMEGVTGTVNLNSGTIKLDKNSSDVKGTFFNKASVVEVKNAGILLDSANNYIEQIDLGNLKLTNDLKVAVDVDLLTGTIDKYVTTGTVTGDKKIVVDRISLDTDPLNMNLINDAPASAYPIVTTTETTFSSRRVVTSIADDSTKAYIKLSDRIVLDDKREDLTGSATSWFMYYNSSTGELNFIDQSLRATLHDTSDDTKVYIMAEDELVEGHLDNILGTAGDTSTNTSVQIIGTKQGTDPNDYAINGNGNRGIIVASGQKLTVEDVSSVSNFSNSFVDVRSGGTAEVDNVTFNDLSVAGTTDDINGAAILNAGTTTVENSTFTNNTADNGGAVYNSGTLTVSGSTFEDNGVNDTTTGNGGAVYNTTNGVISMSNVNFKVPSGTNANDIYNAGTVNVTSGTNTFASAVTNTNAFNVQTGTNTFSGAITNSGTLSVAAGTNTFSGAIGNTDTINVTGGTNTFSGDITTSGNIDFGGTNTISGAIVANDTTGTKAINFTGTNDLQTADGDMTGNMALTNTGSLTINHDLSAYTGSFTQTTGSTDVKSGSALFGGTNTISGGTMALDGTLASTLDIQGGTVTSTTGTLAGTSSTTVNGGTFNMTGGSAKTGATIDVNSGDMSFTGGNLESGSTTTVAGGTMTMDGGTADTGSDIIVNSGTMNYLSGATNGNLQVNDGNFNVQGDLTIENNSYVLEDAIVTIDDGKTFTARNLASTNGVHLNSNDIWNGTMNIETGGILSVRDIVQSGKFIQTGGKSTFIDSVINSSLSTVTGGDLDMMASQLNYSGGNVFSPDNLNLLNTSTISMMNNNPNDTLNLKNVTTTGTNNLTVDINPMAHKIDKVVINGDLNGVGAIKVSDFNFMGKMPLDAKYKFQIVDVKGATNNVDFLSTNKKFETPIGTYQLMSNGGGAYTFGITKFNPDIYRGSVASMATYQNQVAIDNIVLDQFVLHNQLIDKNDKQANRYASAQTLFAPYQHSKEEGGLWFKAYVNFETLTFKNGLSANNNSYGSLVGADLPVVKLKHDWDFVPTFYVGYTGSSQSLNHNHSYQNGGQGGFMGTFIHKDFIGSIMAYGGGYNNEMHVGGEIDHTGNWFAGTAAKAAYNLHATKHFIIQPTAFISYNIFGKQSWTTDLGSFGMNTGLINGINVAPGLNLIYQRETWSAYATFQYMYNINDQVSARAGNVQLPALKMRHGYFQYGIGATKTWKDRLTSYFQFTIRNGGRTGVGFQLGAKYSFDWKLKQKPVNSAETDTQQVKPQKETKPATSVKTESKKIEQQKETKKNTKSVKQVKSQKQKVKTQKTQIQKVKPQKVQQPKQTGERKVIKSIYNEK